MLAFSVSGCSTPASNNAENTATSTTDIYDVKDGKVYLLTFGDGTAAFCSVYEGNGHIYIGHSDFSHMGRQYLDLSRYDADGKIIEQASIYAEYFDSEVDQYDENSTFTYNGKTITMQEYEAYMDAYKYIDPDTMEKAEYNASISNSTGATDYNLYEESPIKLEYIFKAGLPQKPL